LLDGTAVPIPSLPLFPEGGQPSAEPATEKTSPLTRGAAHARRRGKGCAPHHPLYGGLRVSDTNSNSVDPLEGDDLAAVQRLKEAFSLLKAEMGKVIVGQHAVLEELLIAIFARGHCLLIGVPGLAKTLMIHTLADALNLTYNRIQFTPDLMPSDITGTEVIQEDKATGLRQFKFLRGPVFANIVLADEVNRTPPKTQAALLEAMQERQVTVGGERHRLPDPFFVLATQNPIEQEGTYPLPEAQLDRFMLNILVDYPSEDEELDIVRLTTSIHKPTVAKVLSGNDILGLQEIVRKVPVADHAARYAIRLTRSTRREKEDAPGFIRDFVSWGAGPRASQYLVLAAKARAVLHGNYHVSIDDIRAVAGPVLRHRIITNFNAEAEGLKPDDIVERLIKTIPIDDHEAEQSGKLPKLFRSANAG
jgi:MoxR-like ATPase